MEIIFLKNTNLLEEKSQKRRFARQKVLKRQICKTSVQNDKFV